MLRALAPTIPFEVVEEFLFLGNVDEVAQRLRGYADNGCEHAVLLNLTGLVGGVPEVTRHAPDLGMLRQRLSELKPRALANVPNTPSDRSARILREQSGASQN